MVLYRIFFYNSTILIIFIVFLFVHSHNFYKFFNLWKKAWHRVNSKNYHLIIKDKEDRQMNKLSDTFELKNGVSIPCIGYGNEISVGKEIAESGTAIRGTPWQICINPAKSVTPYRIVENANVCLSYWIPVVFLPAHPVPTAAWSPALYLSFLPFYPLLSSLYIVHSEQTNLYFISHPVFLSIFKYMWQIFNIL